MTSWLVHDSADGRREVHRTLVQGLHGQRAMFWFPPLEWQLPGSDCTLGVTVSGELRGRLTGDGSVDLTASPTSATWLSNGLGAASVGRGAGSSNILGLAPGEVVALQLPVSGRVRMARCDTVELEEFFAGHSTSILVSAAPAESVAR